MGWRRMHYDPLRGVETSSWYDWDTDQLVIKTSQDAGPVIDQNKALQNEAVDRKANMRHVASVPLNVWNQWLLEGMPRHNKAEQRKFVQKKLADPDNKYLKTTNSAYWMGWRPSPKKLYLPDGTAKAV